MAKITHKQGDTLEWVITLTENSSAVDITSYTIRSQIRSTSDVLIGSLTVTKTDSANGIFSLSATAAQTDTWTAGDHKCDIEFTDGSNTFSTQTFDVTIQTDISHD